MERAAPLIQNQQRDRKRHQHKQRCAESECRHAKHHKRNPREIARKIRKRGEQAAHHIVEIYQEFPKRAQQTRRKRNHIKQHPERRVHRYKRVQRESQKARAGCERAARFNFLVEQLPYKSCHAERRNHK